MAASCDDQELNQRIIDAFRAHYDDIVEAMSVCAGRVARILYQNKIIDVEKMREANDDTKSKYHGSIAVADAINVYIKTWESSSKSLEVLDILEKHPPLDGVITKIRKHVHPSASTPSSSIEEEEEEVEGAVASNTSPDARPKLKRYSITSRFSGEYTKLTLQFGMMKRQCKKLILKKAEECFASLQELLCYSFSEDKDIISEATTTKELLDTVVFPRCTVTNYDLLEGLAKHLKVPGIYREIRKFEKSKEYLKTNIMSEDFAIALNDEISRRRSSNSDHQPRTKIILYVAWANSEATLKEFRILFHDIFPGLYTYIDLELTKEGSVIFVCSAPGYLEGVLIQMARDQTKLALERRVVYLSVGITRIINISANQQCKESLLSTSSLPLPPPPTQEESTISQPKEPLVEKPASPPLPTVSKPTQVNVVSSVSSVDAHDFPWERLLTWSAMALLVLSLLAVYYSGNGEVVCDSPPHLSSSVVNSACQQSLSRWSYYPLFVFLQSIVLLLPQYLWYSYSKWHVQFFFSALQRFSRQPFTAEGECELEAFQAVANLDEQFSKTRGLVKLYAMKIVLHLILWATCSATTLMLFFGHDSRFQCPKSVLPKGHCLSRDDCNRDSLNDSPFIDCFYSQLQYLGSVWAANCFILLISLASIVYSFGWFFLQPIKSSKDMITFCLDSHLSCTHFLDHISVTRGNDLDFLVQLLSHVDSDLAAVFPEKLVLVHMNRLLTKQAEVFRLMKYVQQYGYLAGEDGTDCENDIKIRDRHFQYGFADDIDCKLQSAHAGVLGSTDMPPLLSVHKLIYQCLHYANPSDKQCALDITFGTTVYGVALGRAFVQAVSVSYLSQLSGSSVTPANTHLGLIHARVTLPDTIYDQLNDDIKKSDTAIKDLLWKHLNSQKRRDPENKTVLSFVLVGPIQDERNIATANLLLSKLYSFCCFKRKCCMLTLRPIKIGNHDVTDMFHKFVPVERMFELDEKKITSEEVPSIQCGPLRCVFEVRLYRFKDYGIRHQLYRHPSSLEDNVFPEVDNAFVN